jgi:hypothetical protein
MLKWLKEKLRKKLRRWLLGEDKETVLLFGDGSHVVLDHKDIQMLKEVEEQWLRDGLIR